MNQSEGRFKRAFRAIDAPDMWGDIEARLKQPVEERRPTKPSAGSRWGAIIVAFAVTTATFTFLAVTFVRGPGGVTPGQ
jgi:hypothetical protein